MLALRIPEPAARPGEPADFSKLRLSEPGAVRRPAIDVAADTIHDLAYGLIRVPDDSGVIHAHPTLSEAFFEASLVGLGHAIHV